MARINLLPWRAERNKLRQREFYSMLGFAGLVGGVLAFGLWTFYNGILSGQAERNSFLEAEVAKVREQNKEIQKLDQERNRLLARKQVIEELQSQRSQMVHLFDTLVRTIPEGVVLNDLRQNGNTLTLQGRTQSNARVSTYMRNLEASEWMYDPQLSIIEARADSSNGGIRRTLPYAFTLQVKLRSGNSDNEGS